MYLERGSAARREGLINARDTVWRDRNVKYYFSRGARMSGDGIGNEKKRKAFWAKALGRDSANISYLYHETNILDIIKIDYTYKAL